MCAHFLKPGNVRTLRWSLDRDLTGVANARVLVARSAADPAFIDRDGVIEGPPTEGIVSLAVTADDYGTGKLEPRSLPYLVEVMTPEPLTHPDAGYEHIYVMDDLA